MHSRSARVEIAPKKSAADFPGNPRHSFFRSFTVSSSLAITWQSSVRPVAAHRIPDDLTLIPLSIIFSSSTLGLISKASARLTNSFVTK